MLEVGREGFSQGRWDCHADALYRLRISSHHYMLIVMGFLRRRDVVTMGDMVVDVVVGESVGRDCDCRVASGGGGTDGCCRCPLRRRSKNARGSGPFMAGASSSSGGDGRGFARL